MSNPIIAMIDCSTGEETVREMTDEEYAEFLASQPTLPEVLNGN